MMLSSAAATKLRKENQKAAGANVYFQYYPEYGNMEKEGGITGTTVVFDFPTGDTSTMLNKIAAVLPGIFIEGRRYKKAGVIFFGLESASSVQLSRGGLNGPGVGGLKWARKKHYYFSKQPT